jgi:hypothetical protein
MSCIILRGRGCDIFILNVHAPTEDEIDGMKESFCEELERVFEKFPKYHMKNLLGDMNVKVGREGFSNQQLGMRIYTKLVMIMVLEYQTVPHPKI